MTSSENNPYTADSPLDTHATEAISTRPDEEESAPQNTEEQNEERQATRLRIIETYFSADAPEVIPLFDPSLLDDTAIRRELEAKAYTTEELEALQTEDTPEEVTRLLAARQELDGLQKPTLFMRPSVRSKLKQDKQLAVDKFESAKQEYIEAQIQKQEEVSPLAKLVTARARFAEASFDARQGNTFSNQRGRTAYENAQKDYSAALDTYFDMAYGTYAKDMTPEEKVEFTSLFTDRERGALAGEEANHYLTEINNEDRKSRFQKFVEGYNKLSRTQKIASGIGIAAVAGIGFGAIGGLAAVGGVIGAKFGRHFITSEAARLNEMPTDTLTQQQQSVLYAGSDAQSQADRQKLYDAAPNASEELFEALTIEDGFFTSHKAATTAERNRISTGKRKAVARAALLTTVSTIAGGAAGFLLEEKVHYLSHGLFRDHKLWDVHTNQDMAPPGSTSPTEAPPGSAPSTTPEAPSSPTSPPASPPESPAPAPPSVSAEEKYLYNNYAGQKLTITIPQGSSIWEQISNKVAIQHPTLSTAEHERITANLTNELLRQQPGINPTSVPVGTTFSARF